MGLIGKRRAEMGFGSAGRDSPSNKVRVARFMRGDCSLCHQMIMPGQAYLLRDGSLTRNVSPVHLSCYSPGSSPEREG